MKRIVGMAMLGLMFFSGSVLARGGGGHGGGHSNSHVGSHAGKSGGHSSRAHYHSTSGRSARSGFKSTHVSARANSRILRADPSNDHAVSAYYTKNGTFVSSYHAKNSNETRNDNYSTRGNQNPYTGMTGTKPRDGE